MDRLPKSLRVPAAAFCFLFAVQASASGLAVFPPPDTRVRADGEATLPDDLVWNETMSEWLRADAAKGLTGHPQTGRK